MATRAKRWIYALLMTPSTWGMMQITISISRSLIIFSNGSRRPPKIIPKQWRSLLNSLITHDPIIDDSEEEPVMVRDDPNWGPREMELTTWQTFYDTGHFLDALKGLQLWRMSSLLKQIAEGQMSVRELYLVHVHLIDNGARSTTIRKFCKEHTCTFSGSTKNYRQAKFRSITLIWRIK